MMLCAYFLLPHGAVSVDVMFMMATGARGPVWVDREAQLAVDIEEER